MPTMNFVFGKKEFVLTPEEFCSKFALVIDQNQDPDDRVAVKLLKDYRGYDNGDEYCLDETEQNSVFDCLGIKVTIPDSDKVKGGDSNAVYIGGIATGSNIITGNNNAVNHTCTGGLNLTTIISGSGIVITNI